MNQTLIQVERSPCFRNVTFKSNTLFIYTWKLWVQFHVTIYMFLLDQDLPKSFHCIWKFDDFNALLPLLQRNRSRHSSNESGDSSTPTTFMLEAVKEEQVQVNRYWNQIIPLLLVSSRSIQDHWYKKKTEGSVNCTVIGLSWLWLWFQFSNESYITAPFSTVEG